jgi:hypothetical protein
VNRPLAQVTSFGSGVSSNEKATRPPNVHVTQTHSLRPLASAPFELAPTKIPRNSHGLHEIAAEVASRGRYLRDHRQSCGHGSRFRQGRLYSTGDHRLSNKDALTAASNGHGSSMLDATSVHRRARLAGCPARALEAHAVLPNNFATFGEDKPMPE